MCSKLEAQLGSIYVDRYFIIFCIYEPGFCSSQFYYSNNILKIVQTVKLLIGVNLQVKSVTNIHA